MLSLPVLATVPVMGAVARSSRRWWKKGAPPSSSVRRFCPPRLFCGGCSSSDCTRRCITAIYGLREAPFELTPNPKFLYLTQQHREALSNLEYGLSSAKAVTVLIGEAGTGKTTLLKAALASERCKDVSCVFVSNPALTRTEFVETLAQRFELGEAASKSKAVLAQGARDDSQGTTEPRCRLRRCSWTKRRRSVSSCWKKFACWPTSRPRAKSCCRSCSLASRNLPVGLNDPSLRQLKQRVALRCELRPFSLAETATYIAMRIRTAGGEASRLFTREAVMAIHEHSRGYPANDQRDLRQRPGQRHGARQATSRSGDRARSLS